MQKGKLGNLQVMAIGPGCMGERQSPAPASEESISKFSIRSLSRIRSRRPFP